MIAKGNNNSNNNKSGDLIGSAYHSYRAHQQPAGHYQFLEGYISENLQESHPENGIHFLEGVLVTPSFWEVDGWVGRESGQAQDHFAVDFAVFAASRVADSVLICMNKARQNVVRVSSHRSAGLYLFEEA